MRGFGKVGKTTNREPARIGSQVGSEREDMWGDMEGEIVSFDKDKQTAKIRPLYKKRLAGKPTQLPDLEEVPVRFPRMGGFLTTHPVKPGDKVKLRPMMRNNEDYHTTGEAYAARDQRSASLSDYEAHLDGGEPLKTPIEHFNENEAEWRSEDGKIKVQMADDRVRMIMDYAGAEIRFILRKDKFVQMKAKGYPADYHATINLLTGRLEHSHPWVLVPDPNPED